MRLLFQIMFFFLAAQLLGVYTGWILQNDIAINPYVQAAALVEDKEEPSNAFFLIVYILFGALMMVVLIRYFFKFAFLLNGLEFMMIATSSSIVFYAFARLFLDFGESMLLSVLFGLALSIAKRLRSNMKNAAAILASAGGAAVLGISLGIFPLMIFLVLLAIYDYLAVFVTKHMVEMASFLVKKDMAFTVTARVPAPKEISSGSKEFGKNKPEEKPKEKRIDLGTGDLIAPITLEVAVLPLGLHASLFVMLGAVVAFGIFLFTIWKKPMVLPALPPIVAGCLVFFYLGSVLGFY